MNTVLRLKARNLLVNAMEMESGFHKDEATLKAVSAMIEAAKSELRVEKQGGGYW